MKFIDKLKDLFPHIFSDVLYRLDWRTPDKSSVKKFLEDNVRIAHDLKVQGYIPTYKGTQDQIVLKCLKWTIKTLKYQKDSVKWGTPEKWEYIHDILAKWYIHNGKEIILVGNDYKQPKEHPNSFRAADCESGIMLFYCACIVNKVNPLQLKFCAGNVVGGGHAWAEYAPDEMYDYYNDKQNFYTIDWCYYPDTSPFNKRISKSNKYIRSWFEVNHVKTETFK